MDLIQIGIIIFSSAIGIFSLVIWLVNLVHAIRNPINNKALWVIVMLVFGVFGAIVYYFAVKRPFNKVAAASKPTQQPPSAPPLSQSPPPQPSSNPKPHGVRYIVIFGILLVVVLASIVGVRYFIEIYGPGIRERLAENPLVQQSKNQTQVDDQSANEPASVSTAPTVVDCGSSIPVDGNPIQSVLDCYEAKLAQCEPAKMIWGIDLGPFGGLVIYDREIIGPQDGLCAEKQMFTQNPNPEWIGKSMTCLQDNTKDLETIFLEPDLTKCEGPLHDLFTGQGGS